MHLALKNILLTKFHSMGIGDLLRSSAAWLSLKKMAKCQTLFVDVEQACKIPIRRFI